jgi:phosphoglycerate dehydrogenase-like enzyme
MRIAVAVVSATQAWVMPRQFVDELRREFPHHTFIDAPDRNHLPDALIDADAAFASALPANLVPSLTRLRWVQVPAAGVGHVLSPEVIASPIVLTSARGVRARAIAEHVLGVTIALARQLHVALRRQAAHTWALDELETSGRISTLHGRNMGIVGLGSIGTEVARLASAIGMGVQGIRRRPNAPVPPFVDRVLPPEQLTTLLGDSDVVVLAAPLTRDTEQLIDARALASFKPGALLVNIGRGGLVDDRALVTALDSGALGGAALDVFTTEPLPADSPYWDLPNVIVTPHVSGAMADYWTPLVRLFAENIRRFERGDALLNVVDKEAGY